MSFLLESEGRHLSVVPDPVIRESMPELKARRTLAFLSEQDCEQVYAAVRELFIESGWVTSRHP